MPNVTITWYRNAGDNNYLYGMPGGTIGPNSGQRTVNITGGSYNLSASGSGPGSVGISASGQRLGLDDRQGAGADNDYDDMLVYVTAGFFSGSTYYGPTPIYGCTDSSATNYNSAADTDDGSCQYPIPVPTLNASPTSYIRGGSSTLSWSTTNVAYATSITLNGSPVNSSGSTTVSPVITTTYTLRATYSWGSGGERTSSQTITVYQPPVVNLSADNNPIPRGASTTLRWNTTGDASTMNITPGIGNANLSSFVSVSPTVTTTYTATASGLGGVGSAQYTLTVWQPPSTELTGPTSINFGENLILNINATNANQSLELQRSINGGAFSTIATFLPAATHTNIEYDATPSWSDFAQGIGIYESPTFRLIAVGDGNLTDFSDINVQIYIDRTPDQITIPESEDTFKDEEPVISPDVEVVSQQIVVNDIDVPVIIKADYPIQVEIDNDGQWRDVEQL